MLRPYMNRERPQRRTTRLKHYDYSAIGCYFVTICTKNRTPSLGEIRDDIMCPNESGKIVAACWAEIPTHFRHVQNDEFIVMPNHIHGIVCISAGVGAQHAAPELSKPNVQPGSLGAVIRSFKSAAGTELGQPLADACLLALTRSQLSL
jgi:putative transposase